MGELETKIADILNSPEDMQKIMKIARSLTGGASSDPEEKKESTQPLQIPDYSEEEKEEAVAEAEAEDVADAAQPDGGDGGDGGDDEVTEGNDILDLLDSLDINPDMMKAVGSAIEGLSSGNHSREILEGFMPHLKPKRQEQVTKAIKLAKMAKVALSLFNDSSGGDGDV